MKHLLVIASLVLSAALSTAQHKDTSKGDVGGGRVSEMRAKQTRKLVNRPVNKSALPESTKEGWRPIGNDSEYSFYYDLTLVAGDGDLRKGWGKIIPNDLAKEREKLIALQKQYGADATKYYQYAYSLDLFVVRCKAKEFSLAKVHDYNSQDEIINTTDLAEHWERWPIGSIIATFGQRVCAISLNKL